LDERGVDFEWRIAGLTGKEKMVDIFQSLSGEEMSGKIRFMGRLGAPELVASLLETDIYVHTSYIENPSNAVCEAQYLGLPVIAARTGGTNSIIEDGVSGLMYEKGNADEVINLIIRIFEDEELATSLGFNARELAMQRHDNNKILAGLLDIYTDISQQNFSEK
jgi:glycosyltransferase involved in cell wall biosynthesis